MPDVLEMPYRPDIVFPSSGNVGDYSYIFAGCSCMAGDVIGEYKLAAPLQVGARIVFSEMGAYTFARENYFNGINHPAVVFYNRTQGFQLVKQFDYQDYEQKILDTKEKISVEVTIMKPITRIHSILFAISTTIVYSVWNWFASIQTNLVVLNLLISF